MESTLTDTAAPAADTGAAQPSFFDVLQAAEAPASQPADTGATRTAEQPAAQPQSTGAATAGAAAAATPDPNTPPAWLSELGTQFKSADEVKQLLAKVPELEKNQLTDEQKAGLRLLGEPEARREYLKLLDTDYAGMDDEAMLLHDFKTQYPGLSAEDAELIFQQKQDEKYPGLANEEGDPMRRAHANMRKAEADQVRGKYTGEKDAKLAEYQKAALKDDGPTPEDYQKQRDAHFDQVKGLVGKGADEFKLTVDVNGAPLNLAVEAADLPAIQAVMENPYAALVNEDGTPNYAAIKEFAVMKTMFPKFLGLAQKAALDGQGAVVRVDELHNGGTGTNPNARPGDTPSFFEQVKQSGTAKLNY